MIAAIATWLAGLAIACVGIPVSGSRFWRYAMAPVAVGAVVYAVGWVVYASAVAS